MSAEELIKEEISFLEQCPKNCPHTDIHTVIDGLKQLLAELETPKVCGACKVKQGLLEITEKELKKKHDIIDADKETIKTQAERIDEFKDTLTKIADQANRATMVQDRSVGIIKATCGVIFSEAKQALKGEQKC